MLAGLQQPSTLQDNTVFSSDDSIFKPLSASNVKYSFNNLVKKEGTKPQQTKRAALPSETPFSNQSQ